MFLHCTTLRPRRADHGLVVGDLTLAWGLLFQNGICTPIWGLKFLRARMRVEGTVPSMDDPNWIAFTKLHAPDGAWEAYLRNQVDNCNGEPLTWPPHP